MSWLKRYDNIKMQQGGTLPTLYLKQPSRDDQSAKQLQELGYNDWLQSYHAPAPTYIKKAQDTPQWVRDQYAQQHGMQDWDELQKQVQVTSEMRDPKNKWNTAADFANKVVNAGTVGEMFNPYNYMKAAAKEAPIVQTAEHIPYTGGFPMSTIKKTKGNTPMPTLTEIPEETWDEKYYKRLGMNLPKKQMGGPTVPLTHFQKYIGLNDPTMGNEMYFPGNGQQTTFRGLDNPQVPVAIIDAIGKQKVLKGPKDTDQFVLPVYEKKLPTERGWAKKYGGKNNISWLEKY